MGGIKANELCIQIIGKLSPFRYIWALNLWVFLGRFIMALPAWKRLARQLVRHPVRTLRRMDAFRLSEQKSVMERADRAAGNKTPSPGEFLRAMVVPERRIKNARRRRRMLNKYTR